MPPCQICGRPQDRRKRIKTGKLVCNPCHWHSLWEPEQLIKKISELEKKNDDLRGRIPPKISQREYRYNSPYSAVPPRDILKNAMIAVNLGNFSEFSKVLGDHYGIKAPPYYANDAKIPSGAIACYYPTENEVYALVKEPLQYTTAFHEFYHALQAFGVVPNKDSEKNAGLYGEACVRRLNDQ